MLLFVPVQQRILDVSMCACVLRRVRDGIAVGLASPCKGQQRQFAPDQSIFGRTLPTVIPR